MEWFLGDKARTPSSAGSTATKSSVSASALVGTAPRGSATAGELLGNAAGSHGRTVATPPANRLASRRSSRDFSRAAIGTPLVARLPVSVPVPVPVQVVDQSSVNTQRKRKRGRLGLKQMPLHGDLWFSRYHKHLDKKRSEFASVAALVSRGTVAQDTLEQIARDIPRTYPDVEELSTEEFRGKLVRVLTSVAAEYQSIGYVQGMNFIVAYLLIHCHRDEDKAFRVFQILMEAPLYDMKNVYCKGLPKLIEFSNKLERLIAVRYSKLHQHFNTIGLDSVFYTQNWIVTLFAYNSSFHLLVEIWDSFFEKGWEVFYRLGLVMMEELQEMLLRASFEECVEMLRKFEKNLPEDLCDRGNMVTFSAEEREIMSKVVLFPKLAKRNSSGRGRFNTQRSMSSLTLSSAGDFDSVSAEFTTASALSGTLKDLS